MFGKTRHLLLLSFSCKCGQANEMEAAVLGDGKLHVRLEVTNEAYCSDIEARSPVDHHDRLRVGGCASRHCDMPAQSSPFLERLGENYFRLNIPERSDSPRVEELLKEFKDTQERIVQLTSSSWRVTGQNDAQ